ncbi:MAG: LamG-like jellyroll fold domain-containing protein, partial [Anaerohalosphaeraceae bacterium]
DKATLYLLNDGEWKTAVNEFNHPADQFDAPLTIGFDPQNDGNRHFRGWIDDVRIYNYALHEEQIRAVAENKSFAAMKAAAIPVLADTKLIEAKQVPTTPEPQARAETEASGEKPAPKRSLWPVMVIVALIVVVVVVTQVRKKR